MGDMKMSDICNIIKKMSLNDSMKFTLRHGNSYIELEVFKNASNEYYVDVLQCKNSALKVYEGCVLYYDLNEFIDEFGNFEIISIE